MITDAFVVVDRATYLGLLQGDAPKNVSPYVAHYKLTDTDKRLIKRLTTIIDLIYEQYDKATYRTQLISMFRKMINNGKLTDSQKAVYNQVLIYLFTIDEL